MIEVGQKQSGKCNLCERDGIAVTRMVDSWLCHECWAETIRLDTEKVIENYETRLYGLIGGSDKYPASEIPWPFREAPLISWSVRRK